MIKSKADLKRYMAQDAKAYNRKKPKFFGDETFKFVRTMRRLEYYTNTKGLFHKPLKLLYRYIYHKKSVKFHFIVPINTCEEGLCLIHYGYLGISMDAHVGKNCKIHPGVLLAPTSGKKGAPKIGNNVYIGPGAKIIGDITIADNVAIGASAVVTKSVTEPSITVAGIPAKKISNNDSKCHLSPALDLQ